MLEYTTMLVPLFYQPISKPAELFFGGPFVSEAALSRAHLFCSAVYRVHRRAYPRADVVRLSAEEGTYFFPLFLTLEIGPALFFGPRYSRAWKA